MIANLFLSNFCAPPRLCVSLLAASVMLGQAQEPALTGDSVIEAFGDDSTPSEEVAARPEVPESTIGTVFVRTGVSGASYFDVDQRLIIYTGDVEVDHPDFHITCDELELHLRDTSAEEVPEGEEGAATDEESDAEVEEEDEESSIDRAIATGRKVVIRKFDPEGDESQVGICRHATYDGDTGDVILRDWPQVQRGEHLVIATARSTQIILRQTGQHEVVGPSETRIVKGDETK